MACGLRGGLPHSVPVMPFTTATRIRADGVHQWLVAGGWWLFWRLRGGGEETAERLDSLELEV